MGKIIFNDNERIWLISDTHFNHSNIIKYANRPFENSNEMDRTIYENWNRVVEEEDYIIFLGDFANGRDKIYLTELYYQNLMGRKIFIPGNHDNLKANIPWVYNHEDKHLLICYKNKNIILSHKPETIKSVNYPFDYYIHGHTHLKEITKDNISFNVCVEAIGYKPILIDDLIRDL